MPPSQNSFQYFFRLFQGSPKKRVVGVSIERQQFEAIRTVQLCAVTDLARSLAKRLRAAWAPDLDLVIHDATAPSR